MKTIGRTECKTIREALNEALAPVGETLGVKFDVGNMTYEADGGSASIKLTAAVLREDGTALTPMARDYEKHARSFGLDPAWLNQPFKFNGHEFKVIGLKPRSRKYPVIAEREDGKTFKLDRQAVAISFT